MQQYRLLLVCALLLSTCYDVNGTSARPPVSVCRDPEQIPDGHGGAAALQTSPAPYNLTVGGGVTSYNPGSITPITGMKKSMVTTL